MDPQTIDLDHGGPLFGPLEQPEPDARCDWIAGVTRAGRDLASWGGTVAIRGGSFTSGRSIFVR